MTIINLASVALIVISSNAAQPATHDTSQATDRQSTGMQATETQETIRIRSDGDTSRPPMDTAEQVRAEYQKFLENVNRSYRDLPEDEDRPYDQPKRYDAGSDNDE